MSSEAYRPVKRKSRSRRRPCPIAESIIHTWVGEAQFNRGLKYVEQRLLHRQHRRGNTVVAICEGKHKGPSQYHVKVEVINGRIEEAVCSCSIGKYGICPHIAAMLIEYSRRPEKYIQLTFVDKLKALLGIHPDSHADSKEHPRLA
ncbi:MAG TPA: hypothetical protein PKA06_13200 [Gemmatales bacterium]|nr:hypothetical protein [Gemmatales bacterium]HMP15674.1 hypothetical protein [Gemmatales bacterium]